MIGSGQVTSYYVITGTASDRLFEESMFSATLIAAFDWNGEILHDLGQLMTTSDICHCIMTIERSSEVTDLG